MSNTNYNLKINISNGRPMDGYSRIGKKGVVVSLANGGKIYDTSDVARHWVETIPGYSGYSRTAVRETNRDFKYSIRYPVMDYQTW